MLIESVTFKNFRALRDTTLPLGQFTLLVGPNGCGKSTGLQGIKRLSQMTPPDWASLNANPTVSDNKILMSLAGSFLFDNERITVNLQRERVGDLNIRATSDLLAKHLDDRIRNRFQIALREIEVFSLSPETLAVASVQTAPPTFRTKGENLATILNHLADEYADRFQKITNEFTRILPEFDRIIIDTPDETFRSVKLRRHSDGVCIPGFCLSDGTLVALALLTLVYMPNPPPVVCIEEPDRYLHPRLLSDIRDALYRLAYPKDFGEDREPVQVIATTHSPYMLDLFRDHPEEIVIASKTEDNVTFERLSDHKDVKEILRDTPLGEAWYSGILGGVPSGT